MTHADTPAEAAGLSDLSWSEVNRLAVAVIAERVMALLSEKPELPEVRSHLEALERDVPFSPHALTVMRRLDLSDVESDLLALIGGPDLSEDVSEKIASHRLSRSGRVTPALIADLRIEGSLQALSPVSVLRQLQLIHMSQSRGFSEQPVCLDETVVFALNGVPAPCEVLSTVLLPVEPGESEPREGVDRLIIAFKTARLRRSRPILYLKEGRAGSVKKAADCFTALGLHAFTLAVDQISMAELDQDMFSRRLTRDLALIGAGLILPAPEDLDVSHQAAVWRLADRLDVNLILAGRSDPPGTMTRPVITLEEERGGVDQFSLWRQALGDDLPNFVSQTELISRHFQLPNSVIPRLAEKAVTVPGCDLWEEVKACASRPLAGLAHKIVTRADWEDLILPKGQKHLLRQMTEFLPQRQKVLEEWGFAEKSDRGLGLVALFTGESGGGKTMAAEIIARSMGPEKSCGLDLYRIDLSALVSKYIGETEKNLARLFDAAENSGAILLFDEGDALFAKRGRDVNTSLDRHANQETAYLLQKLESYNGIAILTTNLKEAIDPAFLRRFRFIVHFPYPTPEMREEIWKSVMPNKLPLADINWPQLAALDLTGGQIRSIAITAGFLAAAEEAAAVTMSHLRLAASQEFDKQNLPFPELDWGEGR